MKRIARHRRRGGTRHEGVETAEQLEFLRAQRCDAAQGFLICKPLSAEEIRRFLAAHPIQA